MHSGRYLLQCNAPGMVDSEPTRVESEVLARSNTGLSQRPCPGSFLRVAGQQGGTLAP
jgi:hypothetical protein